MIIIISLFCLLILGCVVYVSYPVYKKSKIGIYIDLLVRKIKYKKSYCKYCFYSVKIEDNFYCIKKGVCEDRYYDYIITPKHCAEANKNNNCKDYIIDITKI